MFPYFSLILPVYNVKAYLERCVHSIMNQGFHDFEVILVDDGSTDGSSEYCNRFASDYDCIRVIHKENGGLSSARNAGFMNARGEYIWFVDPDDWIEQGALELLHSVSCATKSDIIKFDYFRVEDGDRRKCSSGLSGAFENEERLDELRRQAFCSPGKYTLSAWSHIYRHSFLSSNALRFVSEREIGSEDYLFNLLALMCAGNVTICEDALYSYELRSGSLTQKYKPDLPKRYTRLYACLKDYAGKNDMLARYDAMIDRFYVWHLLYASWICEEYHIVNSEHSLKDGRNNVKTILRMPEFEMAVKNCYCRDMNWKKRIQVLAMRLKFEFVLYWILVKRK